MPKGHKGTGRLMANRVCEQCQRSFPCRPDHKGRFCSKACMNEWARNGGQKRHGHTSRGRPASRTYYSWKTMIQRTTNPNAHKYERYGGRGITLCERWRKFDNFLVDMGERPEGLELDRIDGNGNYEPGNCRWADRATQNRNKATNVFLEYQGKRQCLKDWATELGMYRSTIHHRYYKGLPVEVILNPARLSRWDVQRILAQSQSIDGVRPVRNCRNGVINVKSEV